MEVRKVQIAAISAQAAQGSKAAFNELYRLTRDGAFFVALTMTHNPDDAEDILQESYLKVWQQMPALREAAAFKAWLNCTVANTAKNFLKQRGRFLYDAPDGEETESFLDFLPETDSAYIPDASMDTEETKRLIM